jgi:hypothetical protein
MHTSAGLRVWRLSPCVYRSQALSRVLSRLHVARPRESVLRCVAGSVSKLLGAVCGQLSLAALEREIGVYWSHFHKRVITLGTAPDAIVCTDVCARSPCKCSSRGYAGRCWCSAGSCGDYVGRCSRPRSPCRRSGCCYAGRCWCLCSSCRRLLWRLCWQTLVPLQSLQMLLWRLCWQMLVPPQSLHWRFRLLCSHFFSTLLGCLPCAPSPAPPGCLLPRLPLPLLLGAFPGLCGTGCAPRHARHLPPLLPVRVPLWS